jgi:GT2 family glycosyltransferase
MLDAPLTPVTVGIVTRNRPESLGRCLASLSVLGDAIVDVIVVDDSGDVPLDSVIERGPLGRVRLIRQAGSEGPIVARNRIMREATTEMVLLMDDDAALLPDGRIADALQLFKAQPRIASVACAMAERDGSLWHVGMQPAPVEYTCYVAAYIGFAHFIRRSMFLDVGGYRESFVFYGEEKDLCIRLLQAGYDVVYAPHVRVIHDRDPSGRSTARYLRYVIRNDCLFALYNEPWPLLVVSVPVRLSRYFRMSRGVDDPGGFRWIVHELWRTLPELVAQRTPVSWATLARWRRISRTFPAFA